MLYYTYNVCGCAILYFIASPVNSSGSSFHPCFQVTYLLAHLPLSLFLLFGKTSCDEKFIAMLLRGISGWCCLKLMAFATLVLRGIVLEVLGGGGYENFVDGGGVLGL